MSEIRVVIAAALLQLLSLFVHFLQYWMLRHVTSRHVRLSSVDKGAVNNMRMNNLKIIHIRILAFIKGLHSSSWSRGNTPRWGGFTYCFDVLKFIADMIEILWYDIEYRMATMQCNSWNQIELNWIESMLNSDRNLLIIYLLTYYQLYITFSLLNFVGLYCYWHMLMDDEESTKIRKIENMEQ